MVLKGVISVHNVKIRSNGLEKSQLGTQYKNQVIWSWKESYALKWAIWVHNTNFRSNGLERSQLVYTITKLGQMVLKGVNWVHNDKISSNGLESSQLGSEW